jgi:hypothetical protein
MSRKKPWLSVCVYTSAALLFFTSGFLSAQHLLIQKTELAIDECTSELKEKKHMLKTWCTHERIRIGQCKDAIYVCLCSSPGDFSDLSE